MRWFHEAAMRIGQVAMVAMPTSHTGSSAHSRTVSDGSLKMNEVQIQHFSRSVRGYCWLAMPREGCPQVLTVDLSPKSWAQQGLSMVAKVIQVKGMM